MSIEHKYSPIRDYGMDAYGWPLYYPYGDPYAGSPSPNGWTVCGIVESASCPYGLGSYEEDGANYCCCYRDSNGELPYCQEHRSNYVKLRVPAHHKTQSKEKADPGKNES